MSANAQPPTPQDPVPGGTAQPATLIVLGAAVWPGGMPSPSLRRRAQYAARLWHADGVGRIITTGGLGLHPPAEAEVAAAILRAEGVPPEAIACEAQSRCTFENIAFARALLPDPPGPAVLISDGYHLPRARLIARMIGLPAGGEGPGMATGTRRWRRYWQILREALALPLAVPMTLWRLRRLKGAPIRR